MTENQTTGNAVIGNGTHVALDGSSSRIQLPEPQENALRLHSQAPHGEPSRQIEPRREIEPRLARMEAEMDAHRRRGVFGLLRLRYEAWLEGKMQGPAIAKMQARQALLEEQRRTAEAEIRLKATVQSGEVGGLRHRIEWNEVNRQRLAGELQSLGMITLSPGQVPAVPRCLLPASGDVARHGRSGGGCGAAGFPEWSRDGGRVAGVQIGTWAASLALRGRGSGHPPARTMAAQPPGPGRDVRHGKQRAHERKYPYGQRLPQ